MTRVMPPCHAERSRSTWRGGNAVVATPRQVTSRFRAPRQARNDILRAAVITLSALVALACGPAQAPTGGQGVQSQLQPKRGGVFHVPVPGGVVNLNPYSQSGASSNIVYPTYDNLIGREEAPHTNWFELGQPLGPRLAERWERKDDNTYVFTLRKNVFWHDGQPFTAADVIHTVNYLKENRGKVTDAARVLNMASVEAPDPLTVVIKTMRGNPDFLVDDILLIEITPKHLADSGKTLETNLVGTGPFMLKDFDTTTGFRLTRNERYWTPGLPYIDGIVGHSMSDRGTMIAAFAAGTIDAMNPEDKVQLETVQNLKPDLNSDRFYGNYGYGLWFAIDQPPFSDIRVRKAVQLAIDRPDMIAKGAFGDGMANPPGGLGWRKGISIPQDELLKLPGYNPATRQQDIAEAKRLLAEAGYANGFATKLSYGSYLTNPKPIAEVAASQLNNFGIKITLVPLDRATNTQVERDNTYEMHTSA